MQLMILVCVLYYKNRTEATAEHTVCALHDNILSTVNLDVQVISTEIILNRLKK